MIKKGGVYVEDDVKEVLDLGLELDSRRAKSAFYLTVFQAYKEKYPEHTFVDLEFKIEQDNLSWPERMRGWDQKFKITSNYS